MKICILDGYTVNPGDLSWDCISELGELTIYDRIASNEIIDAAQGASIILSNKVEITRDHLDGLSELKYIGVTATGYNIIDIEAAVMRTR